MAVSQYNSTTYADLAALPLGLRRLPGEDACTFLDRLYQAAAGTRDHSYQGLVNEISFRLGLAVRPGLQVACDVADGLVWADAAGLHLVASNEDGESLENLDLPLRTVEGDQLWRWRLLGDLVGEVNLSVHFQARLLIEDLPAVQLARQSNVFTVVGETLRGPRSWLEHSGVIADSVRLNLVSPKYTVSTAGEIAFQGEIPAGLTISYQYRTLPYELVCSEVGVMGLLDAELAPTIISQGRLLYQVQETVQELMKQDRSYWAR